MLVHYKKNKKPACYDSDSLVSVGKILPGERPRGPFKGCGACPYPSHGFVCYNSEGDCLRTDMEEICANRRKETSDCDYNSSDPLR